MSTWLARQRKQRLLELSGEAGLSPEENLLKDDLVQELDKHLQAHAARLSRHPSFDGYYGSRRTPFKPRPSSALSGATSDEAEGEVKSVVRQGGKRPTKAKVEPLEEDVTSSASPVQAITSAASKIVTKVAAAATNTASSTVDVVVPRRTSIVPRQTQLPPSPRDVANQVEYQAEKLYAGLDDAYTESGIPQAIDHFRELCSSVLGVQMTTLLLEAFALQKQILPWRYLTDIPWVPVLGMPQRLAIKIPDFFVLLTGYFWKTTLLWLTTSMLVPLLFAYFYNLTVRDVKRHGTTVSVARHLIDPFTFNIVKALASYIVYARGNTLGGLIDSDAATRVTNAMFGGSTGTILGSVICAVAALYEAVQRK